MSTAGRWSPLHKPIAWGAAICLLFTAVVGFLTVSSFGQTEAVPITSLNLSLPPRPPDPGTPLKSAYTPDPAAPVIQGAPANPAFTEPALDPLKPGEPDLDLVDASPFGPLPRIAADGRFPIKAYARPYDRRDDRPKVAIMVTGLGPQADAANASFHLPGEISLMFSPYTEDLPAYFERARLAGHEVLIELPMEPDDYPQSDPGPHTLRASGTVDANIERLNWVLARAPGYFAVAGQGGTFASSPEAGPIIASLAARGVGMIEIDGAALLNAGQAVGLAYLSTPSWIDATPSADAIGRALTDLETKARAEGSALGIAEAYPITLQQLVEWAAGLEARGIALVPVSAILIEKAGSAIDDNQAPNLAQSEN
ncbi:MAG: divergent polysaccharide deacetylase family protein [Geminicoccaceae bacterium]